MNNETKVLPGDLAIWFIIFAELMVFGIFFIAYAIVRINHEEMFNHCQQTLSIESGTMNTIALITASYFVVMAVHAIKLNQFKKCSLWLFAAVGCALWFMVMKSLEFHEKFAQGIDMDTNIFYMFYFSMTLFHYFHVLVGLLILLLVAIKSRLGHYHAKNCLGIETAGAYWHMVDLAWIILFPLLYLIR